MSPLLAFGILGAIMSPLLLLIVYIGFKPFFHPDHVWVMRIFADGGISKKFVKYAAQGFSFKGSKVKYIPDPECAYTQGRFRVKTFYFYAGKAAAVNFQKMALSAKLTDTEFHTATESHALRDVLLAFSSPISILTAVVIMVLAVLIGTGAIWYKTGELNKKLNAISVEVGVPTPGAESPEGQ